jgi:PII-like signaling protein
VAGFTSRGQVETTSLVDAGGKLPLVIQFIDTPEKVAGVLALVREMAGHRLVVTETVEVVG